MFLSHQLPIIHLMSHFTCHKPRRPLLIASALVSKTIPASISHFSTIVAAPPQPQESPPLSLDTLFVPPDTDVSSSLGARILKGSNIVLSKYAAVDGVEVVSSEFVKSSVATEDCPSDGMPEFALVGRSNVGKSLLLNSLVRRKRVALTSKKPGLCIL